MIKNTLRQLKHFLTARRTSYSQTGEDLTMAFYLPEKPGFYVDVGANDPKHLNNSYYFYRRGWKGICVEPDRNKADWIKGLRRRDIVLQVGIGSADEVKTFFKLDPDTLSTFSEEVANKYEALGHRIVGREEVSMRRLDSVFKEFGDTREIDFLSVDTEGDDLGVLESNDWQKYRPKMVLVEVAEYKRDEMRRYRGVFDNFFQGKGYWLLADTHINAIYIEDGYARSKKLSP